MPISSPSQDVREVIRWALLSDPGVVGVVENRVLTAHGRDADEATAKHPVVIMEFRGGVSEPSAPVQVRRVRIYAYSNRSSGESERLYNMVRTILHRKGVRGRPDEGGDPCPGVCVYPIERSGPFDGWNQDVAAWFTFSDYDVHGIG